MGGFVRKGQRAKARMLKANVKGERTKVDLINAKFHLFLMEREGRGLR